jgi:hypothetical protein
VIIVCNVPEQKKKKLPIEQQTRIGGKVKLLINPRHVPGSLGQNI